MCIVWVVDEVAMPPVIYNDENYQVAYALLMRSSHTFNGQHADAELLIMHMNTRGTKSLMVCVPIKVSSTSTSDGATFFDLIMNEVALTAPAHGQHTIYNNPTFSLNKFVPMAPYFSYTGANFTYNLWYKGKCYADTPYTDPKSKLPKPKPVPIAPDIDYIVFHLDDAITISPQALKLFKQATPMYSTIDLPTIAESLNPGGLFYNPNGPVSQSAGEIYIDCRPTGDDGEVLVTARQDTGGLMDTKILKKIWNFTFMKMIVGAMVMIFIWKISMKMINGIASNSARMSGGGGGGSRGGGRGGSGGGRWKSSSK